MTSNKPNKEISVREAFGIETDMVVKGFEEESIVLMLMKLINLIRHDVSHFGGHIIERDDSRVPWNWESY